MATKKSKTSKYPAGALNEFFWLLVMRNPKDNLFVPWKVSVSSDQLAKDIYDVRAFMRRDLPDSYHMFPEDWLLDVVGYDRLTYQVVPSIGKIYYLKDFVRKTEGATWHHNELNTINHHEDK